MLVVDEEQRFGVRHKERLKQMRKEIDVLAMSATPIPRTLHMSLVGLRDMSVIETPPKDRMAIQTVVAKFDEKIMRSAIEANSNAAVRSTSSTTAWNRSTRSPPIQELVPAARDRRGPRPDGREGTRERDAGLHAPRIRHSGRNDHH